jgi:hypothetical protein
VTANPPPVVELWHRPEIRTARDRLLSHPVYGALQSPEALQVFMSHHVYAVWDFMSLLKRLQRDLNPVRLPWTPPPNREQTRFINELVMVEESDIDIHSEHISHFELYLEAMEECGADASPPRRFVERVAGGEAPAEVLEKLGVPASVRRFVGHTLDVALQGAIHEVCAAFFFGRENLIPDMFEVLIQAFAERGKVPYRFLYYLHRHVEIDGDHHGPLAERMLVDLCEGSEHKMEAAVRIAVTSLEHRARLWDGVVEELGRGGR